MKIETRKGRFQLEVVDNPSLIGERKRTKYLEEDAIEKEMKYQEETRLDNINTVDNYIKAAKVKI